MTLNTSQVSYYMTQRKKGITQHISAMKAGISVRSGRRIEKGQWAKNSVRHWRTRKDPLEAVWDSIFVDETMAVAAADRLIHHGYMFELKGESYRKKTAKAVTSAT